MRPPRPFPPHLHGSAFHVAEHAFHELTPSQLRSARLDAPFHGVRSAGLHHEDALDLARMFAPRLRPGQLFSHLTAARLWGIPLPLELERSTLVHVASVSGTRVRARGAVGHVVPEAAARFVEELPVVSPAQTWCHLAVLVPREYLVAAGDYLLSGRRMPGGTRTPQLCSREELADALHEFARRRGARALGWALPCLRTGVDSPRESMLRLAIVAGGLPEPIVGHPLVVAGGEVLHPDLSYPQQKIAIEYEGEEHRVSRRRWRADLRRIALMEEAGWRVIRVTDDGLRDPTTLLRILRSALN